MDPEFEKQKRKHFDPVLRTLNLKAETAGEGKHYAYVRASGDLCAVWFERDRGLFYFSIGRADEPRPFCDVETLSTRLPRVRKMPFGKPRLSLAEQSQLLSANWSVIESMFAPEGTEETERWLAGLQAEWTKRYSGRD